LKPTWYSAGPTLHLAVLEKLQQRADARGMHSLRFVSSAGAPLAADMGQRMQDVLGVPVLEHYGSSETAQIATNRPPPGRSKPGTVGIPWPGIVSIVDDDGRELPPGERGEILIRGPSVTAGYLNAPSSICRRSSTAPIVPATSAASMRTAFSPCMGARKS
jgi:acyl-coenzyme A synthetase/AMP-(fatty) acid ligase